MTICFIIIDIHTISVFQTHTTKDSKYEANDPTPSFYIYSEGQYLSEWQNRSISKQIPFCDIDHATGHSINGFFQRALHKHPQRQFDPNSAEIFIIPIDFGCALDVALSRKITLLNGKRLLFHELINRTVAEIVESDIYSKYHNVEHRDHIAVCHHWKCSFQPQKLNNFISPQIVAQWKWLWYERFGHNDSQLMVTPYVLESYDSIVQNHNRYDWNLWQWTTTMMFGRFSISEKAAVQRFEIVYLNQSKYKKVLLRLD